MPVLFHVFVDGAADNSSTGLDRLADEMATKYGLARNDLQTRLQRGRVRVKANADRALADALALELRAMGARCAIEEADPNARTPTPVPVRAKSEPAQYQSGLAAAFSGDTPKASLGALEQGDVGGLALASVDGAEDKAQVKSGGAFAPPPPAEPKPAGAKKPLPPPKAPRPKDVPLDLFAPPDAGDAQLAVALAPEEEERAARKRASTPPAGMAAVAAPAAAAAARRISQPVIAAVTVATPRSKLGPLADERVRLAAGVVLAIVLGFLPAHLIASARERSAFADIDDDVATVQQQAVSADEWQQLDAYRTRAVERKHEKRRSIAIVALAMWGACGAALGYAWFRRVPWERWES